MQGFVASLKMAGPGGSRSKVDFPTPLEFVGNGKAGFRGWAGTRAGLRCNPDFGILASLVQEDEHCGNAESLLCVRRRTIVLIRRSNGLV